DVYLQNAATVGSVTGCTTIESVFYAGTSPEVSWTGNTFDNWGTRTSRAAIAVLGSLTSANTFNPVPGAVLQVTGGTVAEDAAWAAAAGPLVFDAASITVAGTDGADARTTLSLGPGTTLRLPANAVFNVGTSAGSPGELIADGRLSAGLVASVTFDSSLAAPSTGAWSGIRVRPNGRAELFETQVRNADVALWIEGTLGPAEVLGVNRANVGLLLDGATVEQTLRLLDFRNVSVAVSADATAVTVRDSNLVGSTYGAQNFTPATHCVDAALNWWGAASGPSGNATPEGCEVDAPSGSGSPLSAGVIFDDPLTVPPDDGDPIACDDGDGLADPCTGGLTVDCDDNCCLVANASQSDLDNDGTGDACDVNPTLRVSNDPADGADFSVIQDAVDASFQSGSRIEILSGLAPYAESVRLDRQQVYFIRGVENGNGDPVIVDGLGGAAFHVVNKVGAVPTSFRTLTLRGDQGIHAAVDTDVTDIVFDTIAHEALEIDAGQHRVRLCTIDGPAVGARISSGASLDLERTMVVGAIDAGLVVEGAVAARNVILGDGLDGVRPGPGGTVTLSYVTIAGNTGYGIDNTLAGAVGVDRSILWGNSLGDLLGVACGAVTWSLVGSPDCSASGDNIIGDPLLDGDFLPATSSPCVDHGPDPASYDGEPPADFDGGARLLDADGDGLAQNDCGAFEVEAVPGGP
ncbi:MAG TPA: hypothetical protein VD788_06270, partial [Candidatus Polarisedimenticolaceae bacterium]|nr:hypothetical protein [Candidatus Polarisedimenticolaceae bacterium]